MEARAVNKYIGSSPRKMRLVVDLIRGMSVERALEVLHFTPKAAAKHVEKTLRSAVANAVNSNESERVEPENLYVKEVYVNQGPTLKRISPAPMGRAYRIRKRSCHLTIVVASKA
ncbi:MAG: 50S ribosomal protein L22 [Ignavibacterium sp.]|jgi:large subunit ribosomal protein L22|uniref:50S ribosomal protein L22 n=1 Tax=Ignavibacterium sp. TaxID=2651167 RepID=UPI00329A755D